MNEKQLEALAKYNEKAQELARVDPYAIQMVPRSPTLDAEVASAWRQLPQLERVLLRFASDYRPTAGELLAAVQGENGPNSRPPANWQPKPKPAPITTAQPLRAPTRFGQDGMQKLTGSIMSEPDDQEEGE
jgi:hypothetical protein